MYIFLSMLMLCACLCNIIFLCVAIILNLNHSIFEWNKIKMSAENGPFLKFLIKIYPYSYIFA